MPLLPPAHVRPQGGGVANIDDEAVFAAIIYVLVSGCGWRALPPCFGASQSTVHRRFVIWARPRFRGRLHQKALQLLDERDLVDLSHAVLNSAHVRAEKGANLQARASWTGASPGSKMHVLSDARGLPLRVGLSAANTHDSQALKPMLSHFHKGHESHATESKSRRLHADKTYDFPHLRRWLWDKRTGVRIARTGIDSSERLGRRRWVIERTMSWLTGYRRLNHRYERKPGNYLAFLGLASALCCYKRLLKLTM